MEWSLADYCWEEEEEAAARKGKCVGRVFWAHLLMANASGDVEEARDMPSYLACAGWSHLSVDPEEAAAARKGKIAARLPWAHVLMTNASVDAAEARDMPPYLAGMVLKELDTI